MLTCAATLKNSIGVIVPQHSSTWYYFKRSGDKTGHWIMPRNTVIALIYTIIRNF
jgi:hypothetical protein